MSGYLIELEPTTEDLASVIRRVSALTDSGSKCLWSRIHWLASCWLMSRPLTPVEILTILIRRKLMISLGPTVLGSAFALNAAT